MVRGGVWVVGCGVVWCGVSLCVCGVCGVWCGVVWRGGGSPLYVRSCLSRNSHQCTLFFQKRTSLAARAAIVTYGGRFQAAVLARSSNPRKGKWLGGSPTSCSSTCHMALEAQLLFWARVLARMCLPGEPKPFHPAGSILRVTIADMSPRRPFIKTFARVRRPPMNVMNTSGCAPA